MPEWTILAPVILVGVESGDRKGQPKRLPYGSPSGAGKQIENTYNLQKWSERRVVMGIGIDLALIADCAAVAQLDPESDEYKDAADRIVLRAKEAAQAGLAAERGTHGHALTEDHDEERDWIVRAEAGEILGLDVDVQRSLVQAWQDCVERNGLEILAVEASCVDDTWRLAGTLDRIVRLGSDLTFANGVTITALCPGITATPMLGQAATSQPSTTLALRQVCRYEPYGGEPGGGMWPRWCPGFTRCTPR